jgi:hypothetical protein
MVIALTPALVTPALLVLFDRDTPTMPRALTVLRGITQGEILADDQLHPT